MMTRVMRNPSSWEVTDTLIEFLGSQLAKGRLLPILGAGASMGFGLPNWDKLVRDLWVESGQDIAKLEEVVADGDTRRILSNEKAAEIIWETAYSEDDILFAKAVHASLYRGFDSSFSRLHTNPLATALAAVSMAASKRGTCNIISFNFDTILHRYLSYFGLTVGSVDSLPYWATKNDVRVYHGHGMLDIKGAKHVTKPIVFTSDDYERIFVLEERVRWRAEYRNLMSNSTCLFIGLSGDDFNFKTLLKEVNIDKHPSDKEQHPYWGVRFTTERGSKWSREKIHQIVVKDHDEIPNYLFKICQKAAEYS